MISERDGPQGAHLEEYRKWLQERPEHVRAVLVKRPPWRRYRMKATGDVVALLGAQEVLEESHGLKKGDVIFKVQVIEMSPERRVLRNVVGRVVTQVQASDLVMMEPA